MAEFLSVAWLAELDDAARAATPIGSPEALVVEARVTGGPDGDVVFHLAAAPASARVIAGPAPAAMVSLVTDYATAIALHRGETNAQRALAEGRLKVQGDLATLGRTSDALTAVGDVFGPVRANTTGGSLPG